MNNKYDTWLVDVDQLQITLSIEHNIPVMSFKDWVCVCKRAVILYGLVAKKTTLVEICEAVHNFINTPFGHKLVKDLGYSHKIK